jgi:hypothetical protein
MSDDEAGGRAAVGSPDGAAGGGKARVVGPMAPIAVPMAGKKLHKKLYKVVKKGACRGRRGGAGGARGARQGKPPPPRRRVAAAADAARRAGTGAGTHPGAAHPPTAFPMQRRPPRS